MKKQAQYAYFRSLPGKLCLALIALLVVFGCDFSFNRATPTPSEEDINKSVEATLNAEFVQNMHLTETAGVLVAPETPVPPEPTVQEVAMTSPTAEIPTAPPEATEVKPTPTEPQASLAVSPIEDWKMQYWVPLSSGCQNNEAKCFKLNDDYKTVGGQGTAFLTSKEDVLIEESWPSPYLVFWNKRNLRFEAMISLFVDGVLSHVKPIPTGNSNIWKEESLDLSPYKGKNIRVQISCPVGMQYTNSWFINEVRIVPNYKP